MSSHISLLKQQHRTTLLRQRQQLTTAQRAIFSQRIFERTQHYLSNTAAAKQQLTLLVYRALPTEVDTQAFFQAGFTSVYAPRMLDDYGLEWVKVDAETMWHAATFGVSEPKGGDIWQKDAVQTVLICPLLGFDRQGNRLGMGKGYFDRWLEQHHDSLDAQLGLAFSLQALPKVPTEPHDAPLSTIITELEVISCPQP